MFATIFLIVKWLLFALSGGALYRGFSQDADSNALPAKIAGGIAAVFTIIAFASDATGVFADNESSKAEQLFWESVEKHPSEKLYRGYLEKYPDGQFKDIALTQTENQGKISPVATDTEGFIKEGLAWAASAKTIVSENAVNGSAFNSGWTPPHSTDIVSSISINELNGEITITYTDRVALPSENTLVLSPTVGDKPLIALQPPSGSINWYCNSAEQSSSWSHFGTKGTMTGNLVPVNCR